MAALKGTHMSLNCPSLGGTDRETNRKTKQNKTQNLEKDAGYFKLNVEPGRRGLFLSIPLYAVEMDKNSPLNCI